ncbi:MAG: CPBP family intramembrane metalloprotease [Anaerolineae bacterium]|nr:CPBP family intramembrane metalloprotease [Anaerolineae bacterium]
MTAKNIFWNSHEQRLRAIWRILIQLVLSIGLILLLGMAVSYVTRPIIPPDLLGYVLSYPIMCAGTLISIGLSCRFLDRRRFSDFGITLSSRAWWVDYAFGVVWVLVPPLLVLLVLQAIGWVSIEGVFTSKWAGGSIALPLISAFISYLCVGVFEEAERTYQIRNLLESTWFRAGRRGAAAIAVAGSVLISVAIHVPHLEAMPVVYLLYVLLDGIFLSGCYMLTGRTAMAMAMHSMGDLLFLTLLVPMTDSAFFDGFVTLFGIRVTSTAPVAFVSAHLNLVAVIGLLLYSALDWLVLYVWVRSRYGAFTVSGRLAVPTLRHRLNE